jgi:hypothetical protein
MDLPMNAKTALVTGAHCRMKVASLVTHPASDLAHFVNGTMIEIDGGQRNPPMGGLRKNIRRPHFFLVLRCIQMIKLSSPVGWVEQKRNPCPAGGTMVFADAQPIPRLLAAESCDCV